MSKNREPGFYWVKDREYDDNEDWEIAEYYGDDEWFLLSYPKLYEHEELIKEYEIDKFW